MSRRFVLVAAVAALGCGGPGGASEQPQPFDVSPSVAGAAPSAGEQGDPLPASAGNGGASGRAPGSSGTSGVVAGAAVAATSGDAGASAGQPSIAGTAGSGTAGRPSAAGSGGTAGAPGAPSGGSGTGGAGVGFGGMDGVEPTGTAGQAASASAGTTGAERDPCAGLGPTPIWSFHGSRVFDTSPDKVPSADHSLRVWFTGLAGFCKDLFAGNDVVFTVPNDRVGNLAAMNMDLCLGDGASPDRQATLGPLGSDQPLMPGMTGAARVSVCLRIKRNHWELNNSSFGAGGDVEETWEIYAE